jgi:N-carbamoylputrescine amidase
MEITKMRTSNESIKSIRVAAVQAHSKLGETQANLERYTHLVEQAAGQGARLIVLPELAASGYSMSRLIWDVAERRDGLTVHWLQDTSARLGVFIGTGFVEADGEDFFNTYGLSAPDGRIAGFVRKTMAETNCFRCATGSHVIDTELGRIGVGICADNLFVANLNRMQDNSADILLMPHAAPIPFKTGGLVSEKDIPEARQAMSQMASDRAQRIGLPTVFVNQVGPRGAEKWAGFFGAVMKPETFRLGGLSTIADADGRVLAQLDDESEAVIVADVMLDPSRKISTRSAGHGTYGGGFVTPHPFIFEALCYSDAFFYGLSYQLSAERRHKARAVLSNGQVKSL